MRFFTLGFFILFNIIIRAQAPINDMNWELDTSMSDEFNSTFDFFKWSKLHGAINNGVFFDTSYVDISNGYLNLKIDTMGGNYITGGIESNGFDYLYGYFEIEAVLPYGKGLWPTFWIWGGNRLYSYTEIDILEPNGCQYQYANKNVCGFWYKPIENIPCSSSESDPYYMPGCDVKVEFEKNGISNMSQIMHKYAVEWHPNQIIFYLDDIPFGFAYNDSRVPFNSTMVMIDLQVSDGECAPDGTLALPQYMSVNYFRYYTLKKSCNTQLEITLNNYDFTNKSNFSLKQSCIVSSTTIPTNIVTTLRARDFVELGVGTEIPVNVVFNAVTTPCY